MLDHSRVYRGIEGVRQFWREWLSAWETVQFEYELIDAGNRVRQHPGRLFRQTRDIAYSARPTASRASA